MVRTPALGEDLELYSRVKGAEEKSCLIDVPFQCLYSLGRLRSWESCGIGQAHFRTSAVMRRLDLDAHAFEDGHGTRARLLAVARPSCHGRKDESTGIT